MTKTTLAAVLAFAMLSAVPANAATDIANSSNSVHCGADAASGYKRPGGFCDQLDDLKSLQETDGGCGHVADAGLRFDEIEGRLLVAVPINPCCPTYTNLFGTELPPEGILVAASCYHP